MCKRLPTVIGLTLVFGFVLQHVITGLRVTPDDALARLGVRFYALHGGGYWIEPQSLSRLARLIKYLDRPQLGSCRGIDSDRGEMGATASRIYRIAYAEPR